ncbi:MAG: uridine kinase [Clostridiales bacterium]|jgi:uridine kinase|nr:uridine kinase [Clostridiales bacterium]MDN5298723.1 uridine kinase [Clostridiales bacterium]
MLEINVKDYGKVSAQPGESYEQIVQRMALAGKPKVLAIRCSNTLRELNDTIEGPCDLTLVDLASSDGEKIYQRSLSFIMIYAAKTCFPGIKVRIEHSLSKGLYCEFDYERKLLQADYNCIREKMLETIKADLPFEKVTVRKSEAIAIFEKLQMPTKVALLKYRDSDWINLYKLEDQIDYFYGYMVPSTGYIEHFEIIKYDEGIILMHPTKYYPFEAAPFIESPKIAEVFKEAEIWGEIMDIGYVCNLNALIEADAHKELIQIAEALHEKKVATIADIITKQRKRVILIAGPSSSGKTTFANRLKVQLKVNGLHPITISTDNYFVDRELTPKDENGDLDFESLDAVDVDLFNTHIMKLLDGESVNLPIFDFHKGKRTYRQQPICITANQPIIIEGIHGLNEKLSYHIFKRDKFKIYVSALTQLNIDEHNRIPTTQTRLLRRIVRDNQFRGHSALKTINMWNSVRRGEEKNIFPFQEEADIMFNTALPYELAILKKHAEPLLKQIPQSEPAYGEALLLMKFLSYFVSIDDDQLVPHVSILKEFIGGSGFDV